ncbi:MAG: acyl carrier protein [Lachnospira sp.]|nr:acyl carrier protein [Lachnospira sp.]
MEIKMRDKIVDILLEYTQAEREDITSETALIADLGLNSLDIMNLVSAFEDEFDIEIPDRIIPGFVTVGDIEAYLSEM